MTTMPFPDVELDVREMLPRERHPLIFRMLERLDVEQTLILTNDHDPIPLSYQLQATRPGQFSWTYRQEGPEVWQVAITRKPTERDANRAALAQETVGAIVERNPDTMPVFKSFGIDLCCGGGLSVEQAAAAHGLELAAVLDAVSTHVKQQ